VAGGLLSGAVASSTNGHPPAATALHRRLSGDVAFLEEAVFRAAAVKARIVGLDEREDGPRALLNFGHTLGHALEAAGGFERWTHGEAVSLGMVGALRAGCTLGLTPRADADRLIALLAALGLPVDLRGPEIEAALPFLSFDKKRRGAAVRAVFLTEIGRAVVEELPLADLARLYADGA
jgi:3-dehydroquinate synthetase